MLAAAGIVVTEISTPISAPDLDVDSESIPAAPAHAATKKVKKPGLAMTFAIVGSDWSKDPSARPTALKIRVARSVAATASGKPTARATPERSARPRRRW